MILYLLRHGIAVDRESAGVDDSKRSLTEKGARRLQLEAAGMRALRLAFDLIFTSPLLRAYETARIVAEAYDMADKTLVTEALAPGRGFGRTLDRHAPLVLALMRHDVQNALLVGHEPDLSELAYCSLQEGRS